MKVEFLCLVCLSEHYYLKKSDQKKFKKSWGADLRFDQNVFWRLLGPDDIQCDQSQKNFFTKRTSMKLFTNDHIPIFIFWLNLSSTTITKKVRKMPNFENCTALLCFSGVSALNQSYKLCYFCEIWYYTSFILCHELNQLRLLNIKIRCNVDIC